MMTRAAAITVALSLLSSSAFAGTASRSFMVGAIVVRSATVSATVAATVRGGVRVEQVASRGTPAPMLLAAGELKPMPQSGSAQLSVGATGNITVTVLY